MSRKSRSTDASKVRSCLSKVRFDDAEHAQRLIRQYAKDRKMVAYECRYCGGYHTATKNKIRPPAPPQREVTLSANRLKLLAWAAQARGVDTGRS